MKKKIIFPFFIALQFATGVEAQGIWNELHGIHIQQPASEVPHYRNYFCGFSVGGICYSGTGMIDRISGVDYLNDWYGFNSLSNLWEPKTMMPTTGRSRAYAFETNGKGYIGLGYNDPIALSDFWEYNPTSDSWTQKNSFPATSRIGGFSFAINGKGYIGGGADANNQFFNDFWEYDPISNAWSSKATFPDFLSDAVSFSVNQYGFVTCGIDSSFTFRYATYQYDATNDLWNSVADFPVPESPSCAFSLLNYGYVPSDTMLYQYDPVIDSWTLKSATMIPGFDILATSMNGFGYFIYSNGDVFEYDPVIDSVYIKYNSPSNFPRVGGAAIVLGDTAYTGMSKYVISSDQWEMDTNFINTVWLFAIDSFAYANRSFTFQRYDPNTGSWTILQPYPVNYSYAFSLLDKGYIVLGMDTGTSIPNQLWEYDPVADQWNRKADFPGANIYGGGTVFTIKDRSYLAGGYDTLFNVSSQFWEYDPASDLWTAKADIIGPRIGGFGIEYNNKGFFGFGLDDPTGVDYCDLRIYDPVLDTWSSPIAQPLGCRNSVMGFVGTNKLFLGSGKDRYTLGYSDELYDLWSYDENILFAGTNIRSSVMVYPNPASSYLVIGGLNVTDQLQIEILSCTGVKKYEGIIAHDNSTIDLRDFASGIYFVKLSNEKNIIVQKLVIQ